MGNRSDSLNDKHIEFINAQKMFFVATADTQGRINLSPKGLATLRVIDVNTLVWLNLTGSGNETAAHIQASPRMTLMFCAFKDPPAILRLYGTARAVHPPEAEWAELLKPFAEHPTPRQAFVMNIELVQKSCGFTVPLMEYKGERDTLHKWAEAKGAEGITDYWREKNLTSLDGKPIDMPGVV